MHIKMERGAGERMNWELVFCVFFESHIGGRGLQKARDSGPILSLNWPDRVKLG